MGVRVGWLLLSVIGLAVIEPGRARACTCSTVVVDFSEPKDGATDVPLNQALVVEGFLQASSLELKDEHGATLEFELNHAPWLGCPGTSAELLPRQPFAPNTRYELHAASADPAHRSSATLHFTTGTERIPKRELAAPSGAAEVVYYAPEAFCGGATIFACLGVDEAAGVELIARQGDEILLRTFSGVRDDGVYSLARVPDCIELRRRSQSGERSEPLAVCGDALGARPWRRSDSTDPELICDHGHIGDDSRIVPKRDPIAIDRNVSFIPGAANGGHGPVHGSAGAAGASAQSMTSEAVHGGNRDASAKAERSSGCSVARLHPRASSGAATWVLALLVAFIARCLRRARREREIVTRLAISCALAARSSVGTGVHGMCEQAIRDGVTVRSVPLTLVRVQGAK